MSHEVWEQVYARLAQLAQEHRTTLVFVNTRRMAERAARHLSELLGAERVMSHHGSMAKELRHKAEQRLKNGELKVLVATASLELGIDIGDVELVCQPWRMHAATRSAAGSSSSQVSATSAPSSASATEMAAPIPCCAPVTSAILPANFMRLLSDQDASSIILREGFLLGDSGPGAAMPGSILEAEKSRPPVAEKRVNSDRIVCKVVPGAERDAA